MKVDKNSPLGKMLMKMAAEHDPKLREAIFATAKLRA